MKLRYISKSFGASSLTDGQTYVATVGDAVYYRVFDDSGEDYLYPIDNPKPLDSSSDGGIWEVVEEMRTFIRDNAILIENFKAEPDRPIFDYLVKEFKSRDDITKLRCPRLYRRRGLP